MHKSLVGPQGKFISNIFFGIVLGYCAGGALDSIIGTGKQPARSFFSEEQIMLWLVQLMAALHHLHSLNIIHRCSPPHARVQSDIDVSTCRCVDVLLLDS